MFKQYIYHVLFAELVDEKPVWKEEEVTQLSLTSSGQINEVKTADERVLTIDDVSVFIRESTGKFDKVGAMLFGGDIVKIPISVSKLDVTSIPAGTPQAEIDKMVKDAAVTTDRLAPIEWVNGAWCINIEDPELTVYLLEGNCMVMEKVGNMIQNADIIPDLRKEEFEKILSEKTLKEKEGTQE